MFNVSRSDFELFVQDTVSNLPDNIKDNLNNVDIVVDEFPTIYLKGEIIDCRLYKNNCGKYHINENTMFNYLTNENTGGKYKINENKR